LCIEKGLDCVITEGKIMRLANEPKLEKDAIDVLKKTDSIGALAAVDMAEALYQSIRMQLGVESCRGIRLSRGANLDSIDVLLNDAEDMKERFRSIHKLKTESEQLRAISKMVD
jgi:hypothetical protein